MSDLENQMSDPAAPRTIGKYEILSVLGEGGMGVVYIGRDPSIGRMVAIKTVRADGAADESALIARLEMEAKAAGRLAHPNIVTVYEFGKQGELSYLVMEFVEGANMSKLIRGKSALSLEQRMNIAVKLADALAYAHGLGVTHRDIKPANICITKNHEPKILDFGLARFDETRLTKTGMASGTVMYMSPERMSGESGTSDDIFALGAVIYELFTGRAAFPGTKFSEVVNNILSGNYPIPPSTVADLPKELDPVIAKATARRKVDRYQSASELANALREIQFSQTFKRRVAGEPSIVNEPTSLGIQFGENPYTAGEVNAPSDEVGLVQTFPDFASTAVRPQQTERPADFPQTEERPMPVPPQQAQPAPAAGQTGDLSTRAIERPSNEAPAAPTPTVAVPRATVADTKAPSGVMPTEMIGRPGQYDHTVALQSPDLQLPTEHMQGGQVGTGSHYAPTQMMAPGSGSHYAPTEMVEGPPSGARKRPSSGSGSLLSRTRTKVASALSGAFRKTELIETEEEALAREELEEAKAIEAEQKVPFLLFASALIVAIGFVGVARDAGIAAYLTVYGIAVALWFQLVRVGEHATLRSIYIVAAAMHLTLFFQVPPTLPLLQADIANAAVVNSPPVAALFFKGLSTIGVWLFVRRLIIFLTVLGAISAMWDKNRPRRTLGFATFPLLIIEGTLNARIEVLATALVLIALIAVQKSREGTAGGLAFLGYGLFPPAMVTLPIIWEEGYHVAPFLGAALVIIIGTKLALPPGNVWTHPFSAMVTNSPILLAAADMLATPLQARGFAEWINYVTSTSAVRLGSTAPAPVTDLEIAAFFIAILTLLVAILSSQRAKTAEWSIAQSVGVLLILIVARDPASWVLVAPFAILGNRKFWLLVAICSPLLLLDVGPQVNWIIYGVAIATPVAWWGALRLGEFIEERVHAKPAAATAK
jgi:serine/threonine protein kinase